MPVINDPYEFVIAGEQPDKAIKVEILRFHQGDEEGFGRWMIQFLNSKPKPEIVNIQNWVVGIDTYFMIIYR